MTTPPPAPPKAPVDEHRFPCEQCASNMRYSPDHSRLICDHCGFEAGKQINNPWDRSLRELDLDAALNQSIPDAQMETTRVIRCPNCAAETQLSSDTHALECPFCATPVVTDTGENRHIKPKGLIPFIVEETKAHDAMTEWLGRLWFAPNGLQEFARKGRKMNGVYLPYWTFDAQTRTQYSGQRGTVYYTERIVMVDGKPQTRRTQHVRWTPVSGRVARFFDDVLILASKGLPKKHITALEPWDLSGLELYRPDFLAGFQAEAYTLELQEGFDEARDYMDRVILRDVKFDISGDRQRVSTLSTDVSDETFKHILLPVWLAAYKYRGKTYQFVVNGQNGKTRGERPYSWVKIAFATCAALIVAGVIGYFGAQM